MVRGVVQIFKRQKFIGSFLESHMTYAPQNLYGFLQPHTLHVYQVLSKSERVITKHWLK